MDHNILKTSKKDELDNYRCDGYEISKNIETVCRRLERMLSDIDSILEEIDRRIRHNLMRIPIHLEADIERSLEKHLRDFVLFDRLRL